MSQALKARRKTATCYCKAYGFPHRLGSGKCTNTSINGPFCTECGCTCNPNVVDNGIGRYEYWGATGVHHDYCVESDCCDAPVSKDQAGNDILTKADCKKSMED